MNLANNLLSVQDALQQIMAQVQPIDYSETIPLLNALNRILANDIYSTINLPPFPNSSMDGFAVHADDLEGASKQSPVNLSVVMNIPAGKMPDRPLEAGQAARIMTGAPMPDGADAVIPIEDTDAEWERHDLSVQIYRQVSSGAYVRPVGEDIANGALILQAGTLLRPQEMGMLAALGYNQVEVIRRPKVAILSNGDELVDVDQPLAPGKIRDVNRYTLVGLVESCGAEAIPLPIARDTLEGIRNVFESALALNPDMIISSAGVSVGAADFVKKVLEELGQVGFWRINLRPGKPLAFGTLQGIPFFGLPGNPVSTMVTFDVLVRPALLKQGGHTVEAPMVTALTDEDINSDGRQSYLRVKLENREGELTAISTGTQSSGALLSMVVADGLMIVPEGVRSVPAGTPLQVRLLRPLPGETISH